jgi:rhodanese/phosphatase family protein
MIRRSDRVHTFTTSLMLAGVDVILPDGTRIRACSLAGRVEADTERSFGLYMDAAWHPTWPAVVIPWADFGTPLDSEEAAREIQAAFSRAKRGEVVEIGCVGGLGRTGTVLACLAVLAGAAPADAVPWVRRNYDVRAVETAEQERWVLWFGEWAEQH